MFRVEWLQAALDQLAAIWLQSDQALRQTITQATHRIDQLLQRDPRNAGESRPGGRRILFESPLGALFRIDVNTATDLRIWLFRRTP
jgi:hypothetical protein